MASAMTAAGGRRLGCALLAALGLLALAGAFAGADSLLKRLERAVAHAEQRLAADLRRAGIDAHWDLDAVTVRELVNGEGAVTGDTRRVGGRRGFAREFPAGKHGVISTARALPDPGSSFSFTCWLRFPERVEDQQVFQYLVVRNGKLRAQLPGQKSPSWRIKAAGRFFPVAFTVDQAAKRITLYVDGEKIEDVELGPPERQRGTICFGQDRWTDPPAFALDEATVWARCLTPEEVRRLSRLRLSVAADASLAGVVGIRLAGAAREGLRSLLLAGDLFNPFVREDRVYSAGLPSWALVLSRNDTRYFNGYANELVEHGLNAQGTSRKRTVEYVAGERRGAAAMELIAGASGGGEPSAKWAFSLETVSEEGEPERRVLFQPLEGTPYLLPVVAGRLARRAGLAGAAAELCPVSVNGTFAGIHLCTEVPLDRGLPRLGDPGDWRATFSRLPVFREEALGEFDALAAAWGGALRSDRKSRLTSFEIRRDLRRQRDLLAAALADRGPRSDESLLGRVVDHVREDLFLGANPHQRLVVGDLDLSTREVNGARLDFESLTPAVLGSDGRVTPPLGGPAAAGLRVTVSSGAAVRSKDLAFTVLPRRRRLPILRVESLGEPVRGRTVPFLAEIIDGEGGRGELLDGRVRLRGNTSLSRRGNDKKYYRLSFSRKHDFPGVARTDLLYLISGWRDASLMRERLSFDLFRAFSEPGRPRFAPHVRPVEVVVNGDYKGVYNLSDRVDAELLGFDRKGREKPRPVLYKAVGEQATFRKPVRGAYVQKIPDWRDGGHWEPFDNLLTFVAGAGPEQFREGIERLVDVDEVIDFEALLLLSSNHEGRNYNLFLARGGGPEARFGIVPWDYDMTYYKTAIGTNHLIERLHRDLPGYSGRALARWTALRRGVLSEQALTQRIDDLEDELAEAAGRNFERWPTADGQTWEGAVRALRGFVRERLPELDGYFKGEAGVKS